MKKFTVVFIILFSSVLAFSDSFSFKDEITRSKNMKMTTRVFSDITCFGKSCYIYLPYKFELPYLHCSKSDDTKLFSACRASKEVAAPPEYSLCIKWDSENRYYKGIAVLRAGIFAKGASVSWADSRKLCAKLGTAEILKSARDASYDKDIQITFTVTEKDGKDNQYTALLPLDYVKFILNNIPAEE